MIGKIHLTMTDINEKTPGANPAPEVLSKIGGGVEVLDR